MKNWNILISGTGIAGPALASGCPDMASTPLWWNAPGPRLSRPVGLDQKTLGAAPATVFAVASAAPR